MLAWNTFLSSLLAHIRGMVGLNGQLPRELESNTSITLGTKFGRLAASISGLQALAGVRPVLQSIAARSFRVQGIAPDQITARYEGQ